MSLRSFSRNTLIYSFGSIALRFTAFLLIPLYTHYLTKENFGLLQTLLFTIQVLSTINEVGMKSAVMRFYSEYEVNNKLKVLLGSSISITLAAGLFLVVIALLIPDSLISNLFNITTIPNLALLTVLVSLTQTLSLNILSYFRAKENSQAYMFISFGTSIFMILSVALSLVVFHLGIIGVLFAQTLSYGLMWLFVLIWIKIKHGLRVDNKTLTKLFRFGSPLIFVMSGDLVITTFGIYYLGIFKGLEEVAIYALAFKVAQITIMALIGPFQMAYEPYVFRNKNNLELNSIISKITTYILFVFIVVSFCILFIFKDLINIIGNSQYNDAYYLVFLILPGFGFIFFNYIGQTLLHINNKTKTTAIIVLCSTIVGLILSFYLIQIYGKYGLIISFNFYLFSTSMLLLYFGNKEFPIKLEYVRLFIISIIGLFLFIIVYNLSFYNNYIFYSSTPMSLVIVMFGLYFSKFFTVEEKMKFTTIIKHLKKRIII